MAEVKGVNTTKYDAGAQGDSAIDRGLVNTRVEIWSDTYEAAALAIASTIDIAELPADAKIIGAEVYHDGLGASSTLSLGDSNDPDRYIAATSTSSAGKLDSNLVDGNQYVIGTNTGDSRLQLLTAGAAITGTIKTVIKFTR